jgi:3',5'-cyclic AMP phosphodiesterase CpdA
MRLVILNDLHAGDKARNPRVASHRVWDALADTLPFIQKLMPDRVLLLGDLIQNSSKAEDVMLLRRMLSALLPLRDQAVFALGNHESRGLGAEMTQILLSEQGFNDELYGIHDLDDANLVWLSTAQEGEHETRRDFLPDEQVTWLRKTLPQLKKPTILFSHHGLFPQRLSGNFYYEKSHTDRMTIQNADEVALLLKETKNIPLLVQGHTHWLSMNLMNKVPILTLPAFTENLYWEGEEIIPAHYTLIESDKEMIHVRVYSGEFVTASFEVPLRNS